MPSITSFIPLLDTELTLGLVNQLKNSNEIDKIFSYSSHPLNSKETYSLNIKNIQNTSSLKMIADLLNTEYLLLIIDPISISLTDGAIEQFILAAKHSNAGIVYSDYNEVSSNNFKKHTLIDYQLGSIRDDFDFGHLLFFRSDFFRNAVYQADHNFLYAGLYDLRLRISEVGKIFRIPEYLYSAGNNDLRKSGEKQFDYVNPKNRDVQIEMEISATDYLKRINAFVGPTFEEIDFSITNEFENEASVIIPVKDRVETIKDALESAVNQETNFKFNIIVVDNHSTDDTTELLKIFSNTHDNLVHLIPEQFDLLIGGCWSEAIHNNSCGKFAVQLDSDDVYKDSQTLQIIIDTFRKEKCGMVIGSYVLTDFSLQEIPPGKIDHKEWTPDNGPNNALRINGLGAPRAFYTPLLRQINIPNVSYGEDYFLGITISRDYKVGRIYEPLYYCRRWRGNTDAALDIQQLNANNFYKDGLRSVEILNRQKKNRLMNINKRIIPLNNSLVDKSIRLFEEQKIVWPLLRNNYDALENLKTKEFIFDKLTIRVQFNPARIISSSADLSKEFIEQRPCFLCKQNLPNEQNSMQINGYYILCNPFPIFKEHFTIPHANHCPQSIVDNFTEMMNITRMLGEKFTILYNGPACGASAPDHMHFQAVTQNVMPLEKDLNNTNPYYTQEKTTSEEVDIYFVNDKLRRFVFLNSSIKENVVSIFKRFYTSYKITVGAESEPMMNIISWYKGNKWNVVVFPRRVHRPQEYFRSDETRLLISPAVVDLGGLLIAPREEDFLKITSKNIEDIFHQVIIDTVVFQKLIENYKNSLPIL